MLKQTTYLTHSYSQPDGHKLSVFGPERKT